MNANKRKISVCDEAARKKSGGAEKKKDGSRRAEGGDQPFYKEDRSAADFAYNLDQIFPWDLLALV